MSVITRWPYKAGFHCKRKERDRRKERDKREERNKCDEQDKRKERDKCKEWNKCEGGRTPSSKIDESVQTLIARLFSCFSPSDTSLPSRKYKI